MPNAIPNSESGNGYKNQEGNPTPDPEWRGYYGVAGFFIFGELAIWLLCSSITENSTYWLVLITASVSFMIFIAMLVQIEVTKLQWKAMHGQMEIMRDQFIATVMPAIVTTKCILEKPLATGECPVVHIYYANHGSGLAVDVRLGIGCGVLDAGQSEILKSGVWPRQAKAPSEGSRGVLAPGSAPKHAQIALSTYNKDHLQGILEGKRSFYVYGDIGYSDLLGNRYMTQFCLMAKDISRNHLSYITRNNRIVRIPDYDPEQ
jgi:hypothetical protein